MLIPLAHLVACTEAEGPGRRFALWFQGCPLRCPGCCNPEMLPFAGGVPTSLESLLAQLAAARQQHGIEGLTLLGGEPAAHPAAATALAQGAHALDLNVMVFSGYALAELQTQGDDVAALLRETDILVDGPYLRDEPEPAWPEGRRWIGSRNQQIHWLTTRCSATDPRWQTPNTLELRLVDGELSVNGFPAKQAKPLWRRG